VRRRDRAEVRDPPPTWPQRGWGTALPVSAYRGSRYPIVPMICVDTCVCPGSGPSLASPKSVSLPEKFCRSTGAQRHIHLRLAPPPIPRLAPPPIPRLAPPHIPPYVCTHILAPLPPPWALHILAAVGDRPEPYCMLPGEGARVGVGRQAVAGSTDLIDKDVGGLEVPVDEVAGVQVCQPGGQRHARCAAWPARSRGAVAVGAAQGTRASSQGICTGPPRLSAAGSYHAHASSTTTRAAGDLPPATGSGVMPFPGPHASA